MENEVSHVVHWGVAALVFSMLMGVIVAFSDLGRSILFKKSYNDTYSKEYQTIELINKYDSTDVLSSDGSESISPKIVGGSDIINLMLTYNNMYTYIVEEANAKPDIDVDSVKSLQIREAGGKTYRVYSKEVSDAITAAGGDGLEIWTQKYLTDHVIGHSVSNPDYFSSIENKETGDLIFNFTHSVKYTIHFDGNGNDGGKNVAMDDQEIFYSSGDSVSTNTFTRSGYTFMGWSKSPTATNVLVYDNGDGSVLCTIDNGEVTLYAVWQPVPYAITYDFAGGSGASNPDSYSKESNGTNIGSAYRDGYEFIGWTGSNGSTPQLEVTIPAGSEGPKHYVANWKPKDLELVIDTDGGEYSGTNPIKLKYGQTTTLGSINKSGYKFTGWTLTGSSGELNGSTFKMGNFSTTIRANWEPITYKVVFNSNGGAGSMPAQEFKYGTSAYLYNNTFTKVGYTFDGWGYSATDEPKIDNGAYGSKLTTVDGSTVTLYAKWKGAEYNLTVNASGGTYEGEANKVLKLEYSKNLTLKDPVRAGYTFAGWELTVAGGGTLNNKTVTMGTSNMTVTAKWTQDKYTLDVNYWVNGVSASSGTYLKFDVYINGNKVGDQVSDFYQANAYTYGTTYEITNIHNTTGWAYGGVHGSIPLKGTITGTTSVYLIANTSEHKVTFDAQGGNSKTVTYKYGSAVSFYTPTYSGWNFLGWFDINDNKVTSATVSSDVTYYAHWSRDFGYTGNIQSVNLPSNTNYFFECWGAQGNAILDGTAGLGGYTSGYRKLGKTTMYIGVGGQGGYNGGGAGVAGGGATHMAFMNGTLANIRNSSRTVTQNGTRRTISNDGQVLIVAGGGGASERPYIRGGHGGGATGEDAQFIDAAQGSQRNDVGHLVGAWLPVKAGNYYLGVMTGGGLSSGSMDWCTNYGNYESSSNITVVERTDTRRAFRFYVPTGIRPDSRSSNLDPYSIWEVRIVNPSSSAWANTVYIRLNSSDIQEARNALTYLSRGKGGGQTYGGAGEATSGYSPSGNMTGTKGQGGSGASADSGPGGGGGWYGGGGTTFAGGSGGGSSYYQLLKNPRADRGARAGNGYARITILSPNNKYS